MTGPWFEINSTEECLQFMKRVGSFHDGCIREFHLWSATYVSSDLRMTVATDLSALNGRMFLQRQWADPSGIELLFEGIARLNVVGPAESNPLILDATLLLIDGLYYWADVGDWRPENPASAEINWIAARGIKWRDVSGWMGGTLRYGPADTAS